MFYPKKITIPAAGDFLQVDIQGLAVVVQSVPEYTSIEQKPRLYFEDRTNPPQQLTSGDILEPNRSGETFSRVIIEGTEESAGDDLYLQFSTVCMNQEVNPVANNVFKIVPGITFTKTANDGPQQLTELELTNAEGKLPRRVDVSVSPGAGDVGIKWALNTDPGQGDDTIGTLLRAGTGGSSGLLEIPGLDTILAFTFKSETGAATCVVNFTPYY